MEDLQSDSKKYIVMLSFPLKQNFTVIIIGIRKKLLRTPKNEVNGIGGFHFTR